MCLPACVSAAPTSSNRAGGGLQYYPYIIPGAPQNDVAGGNSSGQHVQDCEDIAYDGLRMAIYAIIRYIWHICDSYTAAGDGRSRHPSATSIDAVALPLCAPANRTRACNRRRRPPIRWRRRQCRRCRRCQAAATSSTPRPGTSCRSINASTRACEEQRRPRGLRALRKTLGGRC